MTKTHFGFIALLEARPGKEQAVRELLVGARELAVAETQTVTWYAVQSGPRDFAIFDTFETQAGRQAHLDGRIAQALMARADELLAKAPDIRPVDVLASK